MRMAHWRRVVSFFVLVLARAEERGFSVIQAHLAALHNSSVDPASLASCTISADEPCARRPAARRAHARLRGRHAASAAARTRSERGDPERVLFYFRAAARAGTSSRRRSRSARRRCGRSRPRAGSTARTRPAARLHGRDRALLLGRRASPTARRSRRPRSDAARPRGRPGSRTSRRRSRGSRQAYVRSARAARRERRVDREPRRAGVERRAARGAPGRAARRLPDSYLGIFPPGSQGGILRDTWPVCEATARSRARSRPRCAGVRAGNLTLRAWVGGRWRGTARRRSRGSSRRRTRCSARTTRARGDAGRAAARIGPDEFYRRASGCCSSTTPRPAASTSSRGRPCTYTEAAWFYSASDGLGGGGGGPRLSEWVAGLVGSPPVASTECDGEQLEQAEWSGRAYCVKEMAGKVFSP